jgi:hypothetical protein
MASLHLGGDEGRMTLDLKQFSVAQLLTALSVFILDLENEIPTVEEQTAIYAVCSEIDSRRKGDEQSLLRASPQWMQ